MFNADRLLSDLIGGGLSVGGLGGRRYRYRQGHGMGDAFGRTILSPRGLTILGGLAIAAYEHFKGTKSTGATGQPGGRDPSGQPVQPIQPGAWAPGVSPPAASSGSSTPPTTPPPFTPPAEFVSALPGVSPETPGSGVVGGADRPGAPVGEERARLLVTAMVSAAKADGTIDAEERTRILGQLAARGAGEAERAYLEEEMARPLDIDRLVAQVQDPVLAAEVYAASLLAVDPDTQAEKEYFAMLAARLNLEPGVIQELESRLDATGA
jgi:uncharacterized membrane protein YebE (DUF533 family)